MKYLITVFFCAFFGCSGKTSPDAAVLTPPLERLSISIIGPDMMAHACAVSDYVFTAGHVASPLVAGKSTYPSFTWSDGKLQGWMKYANHSNSRDLGMLAPTYGDIPVYQYRQELPAETGQYVSWYEFEYKKGKVLNVIRREARIERLIAGHIVIDTSPNPGASGSCLFNARNEVVGIVTWNMFNSGVSVDLTGQWWPFTEEE